MTPFANSFYWYDLETSGLNTRWDRFTQFAGQRTDLDLNPVGDPLVFYVALPHQVLPSAVATLVTGLTPQKIQAEGMSEWDAINAIHAELCQPGTCTIGYNNISFDDEFIRFALFRNLLPPYAREFRNGNSRADLLTIVRASAAMAPECLVWPRNEEGRITTSLTAMANANGIDPVGAHDAHADVQMSIALARIIKQNHPKMWDYLLTHCNKKSTEALLRKKHRMYMHVDAHYGAKRAFAAPVRMIARDPKSNTKIWVADLTANLDMLETATPAELHDARFLSTEEAEKQNRERLAIHSIATNRFTVLVPVNNLPAAVAEATASDLDVVNRNIELLTRLAGPEFDQRLREVCNLANAYSSDQIDERDASERLYEGFPGKSDERLCEAIHEAISTNSSWPKTQASDARIKHLATRLHYELRPEELDIGEQWHVDFVRQALKRKDVGVDAKREEIKTLREDEANANAEKAHLIDSVASYIDEIAQSYEV
ncbi:MAG: exodeoxyribonuclease I [Gammaproteobacteria bacterium]|nr:exodeoxyribonuclease I [Gammaproteobacteria bacterium]